MTAGRPTPSFRSNNFDLIRLFAALQVLVFHGLYWLGLPEPKWLAPVHNFPGVPIFYVVSGYLVSASLDRSRSLLHYASNRALRLLPALWICLALTVFTAALFGFNFASPEAAAWLLAQMVGLIYTPHFLAHFGRGTYNGSLWTITVEIQFYLVLPVLYALKSWLKLGNTFFLIALGAALLCALAVALIYPMLSLDHAESWDEKLVRYSLLPYLFMFVEGIVLQRYAVFRSPLIRGKAVFWLLLYLALTYVIPINALTRLPMMLLLGICVISSAYTAVGLGRRLLGENDISYGIYIYHGLLLNIFVSCGLTGRLRDFALLVGLSLLFGYMSWILVEHPVLRRKGQLFRATFRRAA